VLLFVIPFFVFGLKSIFNSPTIPTYESRIEWCALLWFPFFVFGLKNFQQSCNSTYKAGLSDVLLLWFLSLCLVLRVFFNSPTQFPPMKAGDWVMCCSLIPFFVFVLVFFNSPTIPTYESRDWVMCCSFVIPFFVFGLKVFFNSPTQFHLWKQGLSDVLFLWFLSLCLVLRVFFNSPTQFLPIKQGLVMCCFVIPFFVFGLKRFSTVLPNSTHEAGIEWCAALLWFLSLCLDLRVFFNSPCSYL
jgi:hypothetical protein